MSNNDEKNEIKQPVQPNQTDFSIICPHCQDIILIEKLNCGIFRHGVFKNNHQQIPPHESQIICENLIKNDLIYGCGKPFKIYKNDNNNNNDELKIEICEYI